MIAPAPMDPAAVVGVAAQWSAYDRSLDRIERIGARPPDVEVFDALCAAEQVIADCTHAVGRTHDGDPLTRVRAAAASTACALWGGFGRPRDRPEPLRPSLPATSALRNWVARAGVALPADGAVLGPKCPECLTSAPIDHAAYVEAVTAWLRGAGAAEPATVVGIRTSGSFLAPLWVAAHHRLGLRCSYRTIRPPSRYRLGSVAAELGWPAVEGTADLRSAVRVYLVDDGVATGRTATRARSMALAGGAAGDLPVGVYRRPETELAGGVLIGDVRPRSLTGPAARLRHVRSALAAAGFDGGAPVSLHPLPSGYWQDYLARHGGGHSLPTPNLRKQRYLARLADGTQLTVKYLGFGPHIEAEVDGLRAVPAAVPLLGLAGGFLVQRFVPGETASFRGAALDDDDIDALAACSAHLCREAVVRVVPAGQVTARAETDLRWLAGHGVRGLPGPALFRCGAGTPVPVVRAPRNHGHWHVLRAPDGRLIRLHRDVGHWDRLIDPAEDLAATIVENGLDASRARRLIRRYQEGTAGLPFGPVPLQRLVCGLVSHARRVLGEFRARDRLLPGPPSGSPATGYTRRRNHYLRDLATDLAVLAASVAGADR